MGISSFIKRKYLGNNGRRITKYYVKKGAKIGKNFKCTYIPSFGSEPYLIEIGDDCYCATNVTFITHDGGTRVINNLNNTEYDRILPIKIGNNVFLGKNSTIMPGVTIGDNVIVGYGSIVTKSIPSNEVWAGIPAKKICTLDEYIEKNHYVFKNTKHMNYEEKKKFYIGLYGDK